MKACLRIATSRATGALCAWGGVGLVAVVALFPLVVQAQGGSGNPVLTGGNLTTTTLGNSEGVVVSVVDAEGFGETQHGHRVTMSFLANTQHASLMQIGGRGVYLMSDGARVDMINGTGYIHHVLEHRGRIFWTASDSSPRWSSGDSNWFMESGRPFTKRARTFAEWMQNQNALFISSLENPMASEPLPDGSREAVYCDDFDSAPSWRSFCGEIDDYVAHSGVGIANVVFTGGIDTRFGGNLAKAAIRSDGAFAPHTIYVESSRGSTSHATAVLAGYATNLASQHPDWGASRLKSELMNLATSETMDYLTGQSSAQGTAIPESRTILVIRPPGPVPDAIDDLSATAHGDTQINLAWTEPEVEGAAIRGYRIQVSEDGGSTYTELVASHPDTSYPHVGLSAGSTRHYKVYASNLAGDGDASNVASARTDGNPPQNTPPTFSQGSVIRSVRENAPPGTGVGDPIPADDPDVGDLLTYVLSGTGHEHFTVDTEGRVSVSANATLDHEGTPSYALTLSVRDSRDADGNADTAVDDAVPLTVNVTDEEEQAGPPGSVTVTAVDTESLEVTWEAALRNGGPAITGYEVEYRTGSERFGGTRTLGADVSSLVLPGLLSGTVYDVRVRALNGETPSAWAEGSGSTADTQNTPPTFSQGSVIRSVRENAPPGTGVGDPIPADDPDVGDLLTYVLSGTGHEHFTVDTEGRVSVSANATLDHEGTPSYALTLSVRDSRDADGNADTAVDDAVPLTVNVTDEEEQAGPPGSVTVTAVDTESLEVTWEAALRNGGPAITGYEVEYRTGSERFGGTRTLGADVSSLVLPGLLSGTVYDVRVRALNGETPSAWAEGSGSTADTQNTPPTFSQGSVIRSVRENAPPGTGVGDPIPADDPDVGDLLTYVLSGTGHEHFTVDTEGRVSVSANATLDHEGTPSYALTLSVRDSRDADGNADTAVDDAVPLTVNVTDEEEQAGPPGSVTVTAVDTESLEVTWEAALRNGGPAITGYEVEYRTGSERFGGTRTLGADVSSLVLPGLLSGTVYDVRVRALNGETPSAWAEGSGSTADTQNTPPTFSQGSVIRSVRENAPPGTGVGDPIPADDPDVGDLLTYVLSGTGHEHFTVDTEGRVSVSANATLDHEGTPSYALTLSVRDSRDADGNADTAVDDAVPLTVNVTDEEEQAGPPGSVTVTAVDTESLEVTWEAALRNGGPAITGYEVEYRTGSERFGGTRTLGADVSSLVLPGLLSGTVYDVRVRALNGETPSAWAEGSGSTADTVSREGEGDALPEEVWLSRNYPNPFNLETTIRYGLPSVGDVRLVVYDVLGVEVATLVDGVQVPGWHEVRFNAGDLPSGLYLYRLETAERVTAHTMMLVK